MNRTSPPLSQNVIIMYYKSNQSKGKEQRIYNISESNFIYSNNEHTPSKRALPYYSVFYLPEDAPDLLEEIFRYIGILKEDGTLIRNVSIVALYWLLRDETIIHQNVSLRRFQKTVYEAFNTEFKEQKWRHNGKASNNEAYYGYEKMIRFYLGTTPKGRVKSQHHVNTF